MKQENKQKITQIEIRPKAICFCPLGDDWYTNQFIVKFNPIDTFPDYCDIEEFLNKEVRGKNLIIEDAVDKLYNYIKTEYTPNKLIVSSIVEDVTSHSPVTITKE